MSRALVLNASYEPLCVVSCRRALFLVMSEKAELIHATDNVYRSEKRTVPEPAAALHARPLATERILTWCDVERPAIVLGSAQRDDGLVVGPGVDVVRRRSGGGAVLLVPGDVVWADVTIPAGDPLWETDVGRA